MRCGSEWSVYLMWRESEDEKFKWTRVVNKKDLSDVEGFVHYVAFTFRLFRYGQMFKRAVQAHEDERQAIGRSQEQSESPEDSAEEASEAEDDDQPPADEKPPEQGTQQPEHIEPDTEQEIDLTVGGFRPDGLYVVRKMCQEWCPDRHAREVNAYKLLSYQDISITPRMLGHWRDPNTDRMVIEFEYQPSIREYPDTMTRLREYMGSALKHLACLHDKVGMIHRDIKRSNILAFVTPSGELNVKLVDFEFSHLVAQPIKECDLSYGTHGYIAPECWEAEQMRDSKAIRAQTTNPAADMYALGVILIEFLLGISVDGRQLESVEVTRFVDELITTTRSCGLSAGPQTAKDRQVLLAKRFRQLGVPHEPRCALVLLDGGDEALDLAHKLTRFAAHERLSAAQALLHPFFTGGVC